MNIASALVLGVIVGMVLGGLIVALFLVRPSRCQHDTLVSHTYVRYLDDWHLVTTCRDCGRSVDFNLGRVAKGGRTKVAGTILKAKGYEPGPKDGTYEVFTRRSA